MIDVRGWRHTCIVSTLLCCRIRIGGSGCWPYIWFIMQYHGFYVRKYHTTSWTFFVIYHFLVLLVSTDCNILVALSVNWYLVSDLQRLVIMAISKFIELYAFVEGLAVHYLPT